MSLTFNLAQFMCLLMKIHQRTATLSVFVYTKRNINKDSIMSLNGNQSVN